MGCSGVEVCDGISFMRDNMTQSQPKTTTDNSSPFMDLILNWLLPLMILKKGSALTGLGPEVILVVALAFPIGFGLKDFIWGRKVNIFSILGFVNVLLTGVIGLFELSPSWVAVKEAAVPGIIGIAVVVSMWTPYPLVRTLLYSPKILKIELVEARLKERNSSGAFDKTLNLATWLLAGSFLVSSILNYVLAKIMVKTPPSVNKVAFNDEIGSMWGWSMVVIVIPSTIVMVIALWQIISGIKKHTGLTMEQVMVGMEEEKPSASQP